MENNFNGFRNQFGLDIFTQKYSHNGKYSWPEIAQLIVNGVTDGILSIEDRRDLINLITKFKFIPGGRYIYYAGRPAKYWNNCYLLRLEEDTREEWSNYTHRAMSCLMTGGGIGADYSVLRAANSPLQRTGGVASGPLPLMYAINEIGRNVMQGGSRRSAIYASLDREHPDINEFLIAKNWNTQMIGQTGTSIGDMKKEDFNFRAPLDSTNISVNYNDTWLNLPDRWSDPIFLKNVEQALVTGEPGFSFNFGSKQRETLRNACTEVTSEDDSDVCNLGSINIGSVETLDEFRDIVRLATKFLVCGSSRADLPYEKVYAVRQKNRRLGLGLMGIHEWLLKRGYNYHVPEELHKWLAVYKEESDKASLEQTTKMSLSPSVANRAIAPTGSIGILAGTTTGIEPLFAVAYKRRFLRGSQWRYQYVIDGVAEYIISHFGIDPTKIETARSLADAVERRIKFQADIQDYVDMAISSTINLPPVTQENTSQKAVTDFAKILSKYAPRLRGFTCYPDGARGGQPLTEISYKEAKKHIGVTFEELDICEISGKGGVCGA